MDSFHLKVNKKDTMRLKIYIWGERILEKNGGVESTGICLPTQIAVELAESV